MTERERRNLFPMDALTTLTASDAFDLSSLIANRERVEAADNLETVRKRFERHDHEFMAVLKGSLFLGLCSRTELGGLLGSPYGHAVYARRPVFRSAAFVTATTIELGTPIDQVFATVFSRSERTLFDDIALVGRDGAFLGLVFARDLVRIQTQMLIRKIRQMREDLLMARDIQNALLPNAYPQFGPESGTGHPRLDFWHHYRPADTVSGDFFHIHKVDQSAVGVFICDVMGHGVRSALVTALLRALVEELRDFGRDPTRLLENVNRDLLAILPASENLLFATALYALVDVDQGVVRFANAGHPDPIRIDGATGKVELLRDSDDAVGSALGLLADSAYPTQSFALDDADQLLLYTDGIYEAVNADGEELSKRGLARALEAALPASPQRAIEAALASAQAHSGNATFQDDLCLVAMQITRLP